MISQIAILRYGNLNIEKTHSVLVFTNLVIGFMVVGLLMDMVKLI